MDIQIYDYLKEVESARKNLIQHCKEHNTPINDDASLSTTVGAVQTINNYQDSFNTATDRDYENTVEVRFFDCDGTLLKQEIIPKGGSTTPPADPNHDPERLEFNKWVSAIGEIFENLEHDVDYGATYKLKDNIQLAYFCRFTEYTGKQVCMPLYQSASYSRYVTVDWGDGSEPERANVSNNKYFSHEYLDYGEYVITCKFDEGQKHYTQHFLHHDTSSYSTSNTATWRSILSCGSQYNPFTTTTRPDKNTVDSAIYKAYIKFYRKYQFNYAYNLDTIVCEYGFGYYDSYNTQGLSFDNSLFGRAKNVIIPELDINTSGMSYNLYNNNQYYVDILFNNVERLIISKGAFRRSAQNITQTSLNAYYQVIRLKFNAKYTHIDKLIIPQVSRPDNNTASIGYAIICENYTDVNYYPCRHVICKDYLTSYNPASAGYYAYSYLNVDRAELYKPKNVEMPTYRYGFYTLKYNSGVLEIPTEYCINAYKSNSYSLYAHNNSKVINIENCDEYYTPFSKTLPMIETLNIPQDFNFNFSISYLPNLSRSCLIDILNKIRDNTNAQFSNTLTLTPYKSKEYLFYVKLNNGIYEESTWDADGAITWIDAISQKNWTTSITW